MSIVNTLHFVRVAFIRVAVVAGCTEVAMAQWQAADLRAFSGLTPSQWSAVERGEVQAQILETTHRREVAIVGATRAKATVPCFVQQFANIENFKKSPAVTRIKKFASPLDTNALSDLSLERAAVSSLRDCRPGHCGVRLPDGILERLRVEVDWARPDPLTRAEEIVRQELAGYLQRYLAQGDDALIVYHDKNQPTHLSKEFRSVLDASKNLARLEPELDRAVRGFPALFPPGVSDFLYWSNESFGLKPFASITHVFLLAQPDRALSVSKQIYASHYFDASLGISAAMDGGGDGSSRFLYLVYVNRSRIDLLGGVLGGLRRTLARRTLREGMKKNLSETVRRLESACKDSGE